nr:hypothetical protein [Bradyrhizobium sp. CCBAU 43298]
MRSTMAAILTTIPLLAVPAIAQQTTPNQNLQSEADKGIKTENSGASGYVREQDKPGAAATMPGDRTGADATGSVASSPSAQNSGAGIPGEPGSKSGPPAKKGIVGSASHNLSVQEQDPAHIKGLPGNKSGPPAKQ